MKMKSVHLDIIIRNVIALRYAVQIGRRPRCISECIYSEEQKQGIHNKITQY